VAKQPAGSGIRPLRFFTSPSTFCTSLSRARARRLASSSEGPESSVPTRVPTCLIQFLEFLLSPSRYDSRSVAFSSADRNGLFCL